MKREDLTEDKFTFVMVPVEVAVEKSTGNVFYLCDECDDVFDKFINLCDPTSDKSKVVNVLCQKHRRKHQRKPVPSLLASFLFDLAWVKIEGKYEKLMQDSEEKTLEFLKGKLGWEF